MPKFGDYTSGGAGQATDTILVKRGTSTVRTTLNDLPAPTAVSEVLNQKIDATTFDSTISNINADLANGLAAKQDTLTFYGSIQKSGNNVTVDPFVAAGSIIDGKSNYVIPSVSSGNWTYFTNGASSITTTGTTTHKGPGSQVDSTYWHTLNRGILTSAAAASSMARLAFSPRVRFPATEASTLNGFKARFTYCITDTNSAASAVGIFQTAPTAGTQPSAYTGIRIYFYFDKGDTAWKLANGSTILATLDNTSFPVTGSTNGNNPLQFDFEASPAPNWGIRCRVRHMVSGAEFTYTYTGTFSSGFMPIFTMLRDTIDGTAAVVFETTGMAFGAFVENVQGEPAAPTPITITGNTTITRIPHANVDNFVNSATDVTLTIPATGFSSGDYFYGTSIGAGAVSIVGSGHTINKDANVPATITQNQSFSCVCVSDGNWIRLS